MTLRKPRPSLKVASYITLAFAFSFALSGAFADEGYIGNNKIVIDDIVYENRVSTFSTTQTYPTCSSNSSYDTDQTYTSSFINLTTSSYSNLTVIPTVICDEPSQYNCTGIGNSEVTTIGEPVLGTFNKYSSLWQEVTYNGETKYIPFDFLTATGDERVGIIDKLISESANSVSYSNNNKSYNENEVQNPLKDDYYGIYNSFVEAGYSKTSICKSALQSTDNKPEVIEIAKSWCRENVADYGDIKWRIYENMYIHYSNGNNATALETCTWAYINGDGTVKTEPKLGHVLSWCLDNGISEDEIKNDLGISDNKTEGKDFIYLSLDEMLKVDGMSIEGICNGEVTSDSEEYRQSFLNWCKERWDEREQAIKGWMQAHIDGGNTAWDACRLAVKGKENRPDEYAVIIKWCNEHDVSEEEIEKEFSINDTYYAWGNVGSEMTVDPNMDLGPSPYRIVREMGKKAFHIWKDEDTSSGRADPTQNTYIIIHGWNEPYFNKCKDATWPEDMAASILLADPNAQILRVDWGDIACTNSATQASRWISSITDLTSEALKKWGVNGHKTTIIGFSLGTLAGEELSKKISGSKAIMLDPAEEGLFGYDIDYNDTSFNGFSGDERCIVGASSIFGDETATEDCKENYLVDYYDKHNHSKINELFKKFSINLGKSIAVDKFKNLSRNDIVWSYTVDGTKAMIEAGAKYDDDEYVVLGTVTGFLLDKTIEKGCTVASAGTGPFAPATKLLCDAAISTAIDELQNAIIQTVTEHSWVHETYDTIIEYPFHKNILSLHDQQNFDLMNGGVFNVDHRGMIYTERKKSRSIKYLKTLSGDKYILYGNTQSNKMECNENKNCIMYTSGGNDEVNRLRYAKNIYIDDFNEKNDKIILPYKGWLSAIGNPNNTEKPFLKSDKTSAVIPLEGWYDEPLRMVRADQIVLKGHSSDKVQGWVKDAKNEDNKYSLKELEELPIVISNK